MRSHDYYDDYDGVQHDTFHAPSAAQLEADAIRRECYADQRGHDVAWMTATERDAWDKAQTSA